MAETSFESESFFNFGRLGHGRLHFSPDGRTLIVGAYGEIESHFGKEQNMKNQKAVQNMLCFFIFRVFLV